MSSGTVPSRDPDAPLAVVRGRPAGRRGGREIEAARNSRPVVVVLGMHRSGTSLLSNLLHYLGVDMADTSDRVSKRNAGGFWERPELNDLQDEVLAAIGRPIGSPEHCLPFPPAWWRRKEVQAIKPRLVEFVAGELDKSSNLWGFKDPRTCRLLPLWWEIFRELDLTPIYIHAIRSPAESAISMSLKNRLRPISATQSELMWVAYNYDILRYVALEHPTLMVKYDDWFSDGAQVARRLADALGIGADLTDEDLRECVESVVTPEFRNHVAGTGDAVSRMPIAGLLYDALLADQRDSSAGNRALKNQMSFIGLLMKSTAPIIDELAPLTQLRDSTAQADAGHAEKAKALDDQILVLTDKLQTAYGEVEALRTAADVAGRLEALDTRLLEIIGGDVGQKVAAIDKRMRELRNETPVQFDEIRGRLSALDARVVEMASGDLVRRIEQIDARLTDLRDQTPAQIDGLAGQLSALDTRLVEIATGYVGQLITQIDERIRALREETPAQLEGISGRLAALDGRIDLTDGDVGRKIAAIDKRLREDTPAQLEGISGRLAALDGRIDLTDGDVGQKIAAIDKRLHELREETPARLDDIGGRLEAVDARLAEIAGSEVGRRLEQIDTRLQDLHGRTPAQLDGISGRLEAVDARLAEIIGGEVGQKIQQIDKRMREMRNETPAQLGDISGRLEALDELLRATAGSDVGARIAEIDEHLRAIRIETPTQFGDIAGRVGALDALLREIAAGDVGPRIAEIDGHLRAMRDATPAQLEVIGDRLAAVDLRLSDLAGGDVGPRIAEIDDHLRAIRNQTPAQLGDIAGRLEMVDVRLAEIIDGVVGQKIQQIDKRVREIRTDIPVQLVDIATRLETLADAGAMPEQLAGIERQLATLATEATLSPRLVAIETRLATLAEGDILASGLETVRAALAALSDDATLGERLAAIERTLGVAADDGDGIKAQLRAIEERLHGIAEGGTIPARLAGIEARLGEVAPGEALAARFDTIEAQLGRAADGDVLAARLDAIESRIGRTADGEVLASRLDTIEARLADVAAGEMLAARLVAIDGRLGELAGREDTESRLDGLAAQLARLVDGAAAVEQDAALRSEAERLRADVARMSSLLASRTRRARAVVAAARHDRAVTIAQRGRADRAADESRHSADRLAVERDRMRRLALALAARDERIAELESRLAAAPKTVETSEGLLAWPSDGLVATPAEDYGFAGGIDRVDRNGVAGWVHFAERPELVPIVELAIDGAFVLAQACVPSGQRHIFAIDWHDVPTEHAGRPATVRVAGIERVIDGPELAVPARQRHLHQLPAHLAAELFGGTVAQAEEYRAWLAAYGEDGALDAARDWLAASDTAWPLISVAVFGGDADAMATTIEALKAQVYPYWEALCIDGAAMLEALDPRVRVVPWSAALRAAAGGDLVSFVEAGDLIARTALLHLAAAAEQSPGFALIYSDEDRIDPLSGARGAPYMKGGWSDDLALVQDYASRLALVRRERLFGQDGPLDRAQVQRIVTALAFAEPAAVVHLPFVLYHRAVEGGPPDPAQLVAALAERLPARLAGASVERAGPNGVRLRWPLPDPAPRVSLVVQTRDRLNLLRTCIDGLLNRTDYPEIEVVIVDNGSVERETHEYFGEVSHDPRVRVVACPGPYNHAVIVNRGVAEASGSVIALVANDFSVIDPLWLRLMVENALRPDVGIVGARLLYADGMVQHAGLALGIGIAGHLYRRFTPDAAVPGGRLRITQDVSAVSAACLLFRRAVWDALGGLDEAFPVAYHDVDLCLKAADAGYRVLWSADAVGQHLETQSRMRTDAEKHDWSDGVQELLVGRWGDRLRRDRYYSPNLAVTDPDARPAFPPRVSAPWQEARTDGGA